MKITIDNYFKLYLELSSVINKNPDFVTAHNFVDKATSSGTSFDVYHASEKIKDTIDLYFKKLQEQSEKKEIPTLEVMLVATFGERKTNKK